MVNPGATIAGAHAMERDLALGYPPVAARAAINALFALDGRLGHILRTTREPMVGQMRLTWWHDALTRLDTDVPPAEPVLAALAAAVLPTGVTGAALSRMIDGWEALLDGDAPDHSGLTSYAEGRGATLFTLAGRMLGSDMPALVTAGEGWALADLAANLSDPDAVVRARAMATERLDGALARRWPVAVRSLGALAWLARLDIAGERPAGHPARTWRMLRHRLTGR